MLGTLDWLHSRDDDDLVELLRLRPDVAIPSPTDLSTLAGRLNQAPSVWRAMETLSRFGIEVLTGLAVLRADNRPVSREDLGALLGPDIAPAQLDATLDRLEALALVRRGGSGEMEIAYAVVDALGQHPAGLGPVTGISAERVEAGLADCSERALGLLQALVAGPPVGAVTPTGPVAALVTDLVRAGLLIRREAGLVELPREVGLRLRGERPLGELHPDPPRVSPVDRGVRTVDTTAAGQALQTLRQLHRILDTLTVSPSPALKGGGLGVRETRRLARDLELDERELAFHLELLAAANLIAAGERPRDFGWVWTPTVNADAWLGTDDEHAWALIAQTWLDLRRDPSRVGAPGSNGKPMNLLDTELSWLRGPAERRWVLGALAELAPGTGLDPVALAELLAWRSPLRSGERRDALLRQVLTDATRIGVVAFDSLTSAGRSLLAGNDDVAALLAASLPTPVRTILVQADLTVVAPGRLDRDLADELAIAADVESAGSATVYRVTPASIRRALDRGRSAGELHRLFADHSATPLPQGLSYLIDDVARRHGVLRAGAAQSYLRCEDPLLIDSAIAAVTPAGILLRRLAPTVAVTSTDTAELLAELRKAGLVPMAEDEFGAAVTLEPTPRRLKTGMVTQQRWREPTPPSTEQLRVLVERLRGAAAARLPVDQSPVETVAVLRDAAAARSAVWISYVNAEGAAQRRLVEPVALSGGSVAAFDRLSNQLRTFVLHRITSVAPAQPESLAASPE